MDSPHLYRRNAPPTLDPRVVERAIELTQRQVGAGVTPVLSIKHLAVQAGVPVSFLEKVASRELDPYTVYSIRKRDRVSKRSIAAPHEPLRQTQRWLLDNVFGKLPTHPSAFAYVSGRSAPQSARVHVGASWMLKIDLHDFFHHFDEVQVFNLLKQTEYGALVRLEIARIVTRQPNSVQTWLPKKYGVPANRRESGYSNLEELSSHIFDSGEVTSEFSSFLPHGQGIFLGYLPQGSPSSGAISNLLARPLDVDLADFAKAEQLVYTRYADDIVLSSSGHFTRKRAVDLLHGTRRIIRRHGLEPHDGKTKIVGPGLPLELLGIRVDGERLQVAARFRKRINFHLRGIAIFGAAGHSDHCGFHDPFGMERHIRGLIRYTHDVDPNLAAKYFQQLEEALRGRREGLT